MKKAAADTSALISLALSEKLELIAETILLYACGTVVNELEEMAEFKDHYGLAAKQALKLIKENKIKLEKTIDTKKAENLVDKNIDAGEAACFVLALEKNIPAILMDDINAAYALSGFARANNISLKISAAAIIELVKANKIEKTQAIKALEKMIKNRGWEKSILQYLIEKYMKKL